MSKATQFMIYTLQSSGCKKNCLNESKSNNNEKENEEEKPRDRLEKSAKRWELEKEKETQSSHSVCRAIDNIICSMLSECIGCCRQTETLRPMCAGKCLFDWATFRPFSCTFCHIFLFSFTLLFSLFLFRAHTFVCSFRFRLSLNFFLHFFFFSFISNKKTIFKLYATQNTYYFLISPSMMEFIFYFTFPLCAHRFACELGVVIDSMTLPNNGFNAESIVIVSGESSKDDSSHYISEKKQLTHRMSGKNHSTEGLAQRLGPYYCD